MQRVIPFLRKAMRSSESPAVGNIRYFELKKPKTDMPKRQIKFIAAWTEIHKDELIANWELAINEEPLYKIEPLR